MTLRGKVGIVTGGDSGIGKAIVLSLAERASYLTGTTISVDGGIMHYGPVL